MNTKDMQEKAYYEKMVAQREDMRPQQLRADGVADRGFLSSLRPEVKLWTIQTAQSVQKCKRGDLPAHYLNVLEEDETRSQAILDKLDALIDAPASPAAAYEKMSERHTKALGESMKQTTSESEHKKNRAAYTEYLLMCVRIGDWHGVSDTANDLRVLEAKQ